MGKRERFAKVSHIGSKIISYIRSKVKQINMGSSVKEGVKSTLESCGHGGKDRGRGAGIGGKRRSEVRGQKGPKGRSDWDDCLL